MESSCPSSVAQALQDFSEQLSSHGYDLIMSFAEILTTGIIYGVHMVLNIAAITILWRRKGGVKRAKATLGVSVVILFLLSTADLCCTMVYTIAGVQSLFIDNPNLPIETKNDAYLNGYRTLMNIHSLLFPVAFIIGDAIVIWRACALSGGKRTIVFLLVALQLVLTGQHFQQNFA
ncbi:hypothetical protein PM082_004061 [Marasmius tenuissimus]|nr:hypothetical protein PM082_004061 [Marasmius tenuissimus]